MWWSWVGGYRYLRIDVASTANAGLVLPSRRRGVHRRVDLVDHVQVSRPADHRAVQLPAKTAKVTLDLATLFADSNLDSQADPMLDPVTGCMSSTADPECPPLFAKLGLAFESNDRRAGADLLRSLAVGMRRSQYLALTLMLVARRRLHVEEQAARPTSGSSPTRCRSPVIPADNPMTVEKVDLGRHLFYEKRLSGNQSYACSNCHQQRNAFTDGRPTPVGSTGTVLPRNTMPLINAAYMSMFMWANPLLTHARGADPRCRCTPTRPSRWAWASTPTRSWRACRATPTIRRASRRRSPATRIPSR